MKYLKRANKFGVISLLCLIACHIFNLSTNSIIFVLGFNCLFPCMIFWGITGLTMITLEAINKE